MINLAQFISAPMFNIRPVFIDVIPSTKRPLKRVHVCQTLWFNVLCMSTYCTYVYVQLQLSELFNVFLQFFFSSFKLLSVVRLFRWSTMMTVLIYVFAACVCIAYTYMCMINLPYVMKYSVAFSGEVTSSINQFSSILLVTLGSHHCRVRCG